MKKYFSYLPKVRYSLDDKLKNTELVTDITSVVNLLEPYASDRKYYYTLIIKDGLKPEDVSYLVYGDPGYHWIVLHFNKVVDPQFDWPMSQAQLDDYIAGKYGSLTAAQAGVKAYYRVVKKLVPGASTYYTENIEISAADYANTTLDTAGTNWNLANGASVMVYQDRKTVSFYDYESELNDSRREIKLIQKQYIGEIQNNLQALNA